MILFRTHEQSDSKILDHLLSHYKNFKDAPEDYKFNLSFAWEEEEIQFPSISLSIVELAKKLTFNSSVLVIVGYSIPFFNREIDMDIIKNMNVDRIYIQDLYPKMVAERIASLGISPSRIQTIDNVGQFFLPPELTL